MANEPDNIVLVYPRRLDEKLDRVGEDVRELNGPMAAVEKRLAAVEISLAGLNRPIDRLESRLERVEKRLDLVELPH